MALSHQLQAVPEQRLHSRFQGQLPDHVGGRPLGDCRCNVLIHAQHFIDTDPALVTTALAAGTDGGPRRVMVGPEEGHLRFVACHQTEASKLHLAGSVGLPASGAHPAHQTLGHDPDQGSRDHEGLHTHLVQPRDRARGIVGMKRAEHQMARESGFDGSLRGFQIAGFPHQQHIRVLSHEGSQGCREVESLIPVHLALSDPRQRVFDRILNGGDVDAGVVSLRQQRVERCRFA